MSRFLLAVVAFFLPPLVLALAIGIRARSTLLVGTLWLVGMALFWLLFAGLGFLIIILSGCAGFLAILRKPQRDMDF